MKDREKRLLGAFALLLGIAVGVILFDLYRDRRNLLDSERETLDLELVEIEALLEERDFWVARGEWLDAHQPVFASRESADNAIFQKADQPEEEGVSVADVQLIEAFESGSFTQAGVRLTATGPLEAVFRWLHRLQRPEDFRVIQNLKVIPDSEESGQVRCGFELLRWYAPERT